MGSETRIPDDFITTEPASEDVSALRPSNDDTFTVSSDDIPVIFVRIVEEGSEPVPVDEIVVDGQVAELEVYYKDTDETDVPFKPITQGDSETPEVCAGTSCAMLEDPLCSLLCSPSAQVFTPEEAKPETVRAKLPNKVFATIVKIVVRAAPDAPETIEIQTVRIFACFEEVTTTVTTTPSATTTVTTTTRVTPTTTTTTTVQTTTLAPATTTTTGKATNPWS